MDLGPTHRCPTCQAGYWIANAICSGSYDATTGRFVAHKLADVVPIHSAAGLLPGQEDKP